MRLQDKVAIVTDTASGMGKEIAEAAVFLGSDEASFVNGQVLAVDGGWTAY